MNPGAIKAWHLHKEMALNYAVPVGNIKMVLYDDREGSRTRGELMEIFTGPDDYKLVHVPPLVWNGFKGIGAGPALVANCATVPHRPRRDRPARPLLAHDPVRLGAEARLTMARRALVIGASGQVGFQASTALRAGGWQVVGTYASHPAPGLVPLDLRSAEEVRARVKDVAADLVVLASALTNVERCEDEPALAAAMNAEAPAVVAEAARASGGRTLFLSTEYVFDGKAGPYGEDAPASPVSVYGRTKLEGERAVLRADPANLSIRTTVVYSWRPGDKNFLMQLVLAARRRSRMRVPADQVSSPTYAPDLGRAIAALAGRRAAGVLNVAGPDVLGRYDFAVRAARILGLDASLLDAVPTAGLDQKAARPLAAGLRTERLRALGIAMRASTRASARSWARAGRGPRATGRPPPSPEPPGSTRVAPHEGRHPVRRARHPDPRRERGAPEADAADRRQADRVAHHEGLRAPRRARVRAVPRLQGLAHQGVLPQLLAR